MNKLEKGIHDLSRRAGLGQLSYSEIEQELRRIGTEAHGYVPEVTPDTYIVICRDDSEYNGPPGAYVLATRQVFETAFAAETYARGVARSREAIVVGGRWGQLRVRQGE